MTMIGMSLVDRVGRKILFIIGTAGIILSLTSVGLLFLRSEKISVDRSNAVQAMIQPDQTLSLKFTPDAAQQLLSAGAEPSRALDSHRVSLVVVYSCGDFTAATNFVRSDDETAPLTVSRGDCLPLNKFDAFLKNPFASLDTARSAPLRIDHALISDVPQKQHGWLVALGLYLFMGFYAVGPGVCVWLALTELMPTRIRSNGMSIALVINQLVSTVLAGIFLPFVSKYGYSTMFFVFASFTIIYILTVAIFLPETKGKTLEEIEGYFEAKGKRGKPLPSL